MSEATTTTTVTTPTPITVQGGDAPLLFDDITSSLSQASKDEIAAKSAKKASKEPEKKELKNTNDEPKEKQSKETGKEKEEKLEAKQDKEEAEQRKKYKAARDKEQWEIDEDAEFEHPVNGQLTKVKLKELLSDFSGRTNWSKKFQDLSVKEKQILGESSKLQSANDRLKAVFAEQDPNLRFYKMAEFSGVSPVEFRQKYLDDNLKLLEKYQTMTDDERKADALAFENGYLKHQADTQAKFLAESQAKKQLEAKISELTASHEITPDEFQFHDQDLKKIYAENGRDLKEVTPELVAETTVKNKLWAAALPIFEKINHKMDQESMIEFVDKAFVHKLKPADLEDVIDQLYGVSKAKQIVEEKQKEAEAFKTGQAPKHQRPKPKEDDIWSFDQM